MAKETRSLAQFATSLAREQIPSCVRSLAVDLLVDQVGVQIGGSGRPWSQQVRLVYGRAGVAAEATVLKHGDWLPVGAAAFSNHPPALPGDGYFPLNVGDRFCRNAEMPSFLSCVP